MRLSSSFAVILCAVLSIPASAQDWRGGQGRLEGKVLDPDGKPVANAVVKLDLPGRGGTELKTDAKGHWAILGLAGGNWNIDVTAQGFVVKKVTVPVSDVSRIPPVEIRLSKPAGPPPELAAALQKGDEAYKTAQEASDKAQSLSGDAQAEQEKKAK